MTAAWSLILGSGLLFQAATGTPVVKSGVQTPVVRAEDDKGTAGEMPLDTASVPDPTDRSALESPTVAMRAGHGDRIPEKTALSVRLDRALSSATVRNGDVLHGALLQPVRTAHGATLAAGTRVTATVLSVAKAGEIASPGELTLELLQVGGLPVASNVVEFDGQPGHRDVADSNPDKGTEAVVAAGAPLRFQVLGDGLELGSAPLRGGKAGAAVSAGHGSVGAPGSFAAPAAGSTPTTAIHGMTTPH
jgi:hypothetical protein